MLTAPLSKCHKVNICCFRSRSEGTSSTHQRSQVLHTFLEQLKGGEEAAVIVSKGIIKRNIHE